MVMDRAYDSVRPIPEALPRCSMASRAAERAARAPRHSNRMLSHLRIRDQRDAGTEMHYCLPALATQGTQALKRNAAPSAVQCLILVMCSQYQQSG